MLVDAIRAEGFRLSKNRTLMFLSVLFTPLLFALGGVGYHVISKSKGDEAAAAAGLAVTAGGEAVNLAEALNMGAGAGANGFILVFMLIAAATLYAGDYRWETWRLITPRNGRVALLLGKLGVLKLLALAAMVAFLIASFIFFVSQAMVYQRPMSFSYDVSETGSLALIWLLSWTRIVQFAMIALLTAVISRSLLAALFVPWALGFAQSLLGQFMPLIGWEPQMWAPQLLLPGLAYDTLKAAVMGTIEAPLTIATAWRSLIGLTLWTLVPLALAIAWFKRQDLSKE
ncbi:ABC transporter permease subunit [Brevundimonas sp.]|uniref:ABC transporter permease subunit n=1 Tax=Brevundimonas sp. TaxID=1871086 RepID=UPI002D4BF2A4|nr:ABC transporter permease subunit [Brevundimonas sp.]HYD27740.1 ABC transporter permease subunit [Brevundimonas sp.]